MKEREIVGFVALFLSVLIGLSIQVGGCHMTRGEQFVHYWPLILLIVAVGFFGILMVSGGDEK